jgi:3-oxoadipate enol-lactonase
MPLDHVNGVELYWEQRGGGPRLLFCNGSGLTLQDVRLLLDPLTASFDLLAWDCRGFGRSGPVTHPYTMADVQPTPLSCWRSPGGSPAGCSA